MVVARTYTVGMKTVGMSRYERADERLFTPGDGAFPPVLVGRERQQAVLSRCLSDLNRLGYIWCPPGQLPPVVWSAGIPSLMQYMLDQAAPSVTGAS